MTGVYCVAISQTCALGRAIALIVVSMICRGKLYKYYQDYAIFIAVNNENIFIFFISVVDFIGAVTIACLLPKRSPHPHKSLITKLFGLAFIFLAVQSGLIYDILGRIEHPDQNDGYVDTRTTYLCGFGISSLSTLIQLTSYVYLCTCTSRYYVSNLQTHRTNKEEDTKHLWISHTDATKTKDGHINNAYTQNQWLNWHSHYPQKHPVSIV